MKTVKMLPTTTPTEFVVWEPGDALLEKMYEIDDGVIIVLTDAGRFDRISGDRVFLTKYTMNVGWESWFWTIHKDVSHWVEVP